MAASEHELFQEHERANWVRLRTLVVLRWFAITGQIGAIVVAVGLFQLQMQVGFAAMAIGASVLANLFFTFLSPENRRLSEREAAIILVFDVLQLGVLLYLTGGLNNPFALLIMAPATIAATVLHLRSTVLLGALTIAMITLAANWHLPVFLPDGVEMALPDLFLFGFWTALVIGVVFLTIYARQVTDEMHMMREGLVATQLALAREQKLTDLGGVVAAAAHELGTPLATIMLVSSELADALQDQPELAQDAALIRAQADRCRDILRSMGRVGKDDLHLRRAPLETVVLEAAEPHMARGKAIHFAVLPDDVLGADDPRQPIILRRPEIIHGLRNLIQNAVDFAATTVEIESTWTDKTIVVRIEDDGPGFPPAVIPRIGDPFVRQRRPSESPYARPGYEGMGLGLFIAKTLLERSGARLSFANGAGAGPADPEGARGAIVIVEWPRDRLDSLFDRMSEGLGQNLPISA
jgi:two-component system, sensor histidine kinase RegB